MSTSKVQLNAHYWLELLWNRPDDVLADLNHIQSEDPFVYREVGRVLAFWQRADAEIFCDRWIVECYVEPEHLTASLIELLAQRIQAVTQCREPFFVVAFPREQAKALIHSKGQIYQDDLFL